MGELTCTAAGVSDEQALYDLFIRTGSVDAIEVAKNPKYLKATVKVLKATKDLLQANKDVPAAFAAAMSSATAGFGAGVEASGGAKSAKMAAALLNVSSISMNLVKIGKYAQGGQLALVGLAFSEKVVLAAGLATDEERAKCFSAIASVGISTGVGVVAGFGVLGLFALAAGSYDVYASCRKEHFGIK
jgi:hypothetical protein